MTTPNRLQTLRAIAATAATGATREQLLSTTGTAPELLATLINNAMKASYIRSERLGTKSIYRITPKGQAVIDKHAQKSARACAPARPARKAHDIARITHSDPDGRSGNLSQERRAIERVLREARQPITSAFIADRAAVDRQKVTRMLQRIQRDGWAIMTKGEGKEFLWSARDRSANIVAAGSLEQPHVNSTQPNGDQAYWARYTSELMTPARRELQA